MDIIAQLKLGHFGFHMITFVCGRRYRYIELGFIVPLQIFYITELDFIMPFRNFYIRYILMIFIGVRHTPNDGSYTTSQSYNGSGC